MESHNLGLILVDVELPATTVCWSQSLPNSCPRPPPPHQTTGLFYVSAWLCRCQIRPGKKRHHIVVLLTLLSLWVYYHNCGKLPFLLDTSSFTFSPGPEGHWSFHFLIHSSFSCLSSLAAFSLALLTETDKLFDGKKEERSISDTRHGCISSQLL